MKASVLFAPKTKFEIREVVVDKPAPHEVLVRIAASGLCHSDYHYVAGDLSVAMPAVLGHETAGIVEAIGSEVAAVAVGDHVVACPSSFCGHCNPCVSGLNHLCQDKPKRSENSPPRLSLADGTPVQQGALIGGFAEQMLVHENALVALPREVPLDRAALLGCGVMTGLGTVFNAAKVTAGSRVVVIGCGGVGLNVIQGARLAGADQIIAVDRVPGKLEMARTFGATDTVASDERVVQAVRDLSKGGVDFAFEVIGLPATVEQAVLMLAPRGLMVMVGTMALTAKFSLPGFVFKKNEWRMTGTYLGSSPFTREIPRYAQLYMKGKLDLDSLISERIALDDVNRGFEVMLGATQARSVIIFPDVLKEAAARA